jgi:biotin operon repressor
MEQTTLDRYLILLNAINQGKGIEEMEAELGVSRQIVQRYLARLKENGYYTAQIGKSGRKEKNKSRTLTPAGFELLRGYGYDV